MSQSRLELLTTRLSGVHSNQLSYWLYYNEITLGKTRTFNPQIRSLILYPIEPRARNLVYTHNNSRSSEKRDSNPQPLPWQGSALPLSYFRGTPKSSSIINR